MAKILSSIWGAITGPFSGLRDWALRRFVIKFLVEGTESLLAKIPGNGAKTATGYLVAILGLVKQVFPEVAPWVDVYLDEAGLTAIDIAGGGVATALLGYVHKGLKWLRAKIYELEREDLLKEASKKLETHGPRFVNN